MLPPCLQVWRGVQQRYFRVGELGAGWELHGDAQQDHEHRVLGLGSALLRARTGHTRVHGVARPRSPGKWPVLPCLFFLRVHHIAQSGYRNVLVCPPGSSAANCRTKILSFNAFLSVLMWSVSLRYVFIGSSPIYVYFISGSKHHSKCLLAIKVTMEKVNICLHSLG